jgi:hypothetical protein
MGAYSRHKSSVYTGLNLGTRLDSPPAKPTILVVPEVLGRDGEDAETVERTLTGIRYVKD